VQVLALPTAFIGTSSADEDHPRMPRFVALALEGCPVYKIDCPSPRARAACAYWNCYGLQARAFVLRVPTRVGDFLRTGLIQLGSAGLDTSASHNHLRSGNSANVVGADPLPTPLVQLAIV
jgi:hypothetical protein